jgi:glycosyltransferase involved in cell wall biosynthesis
MTTDNRSTAPSASVVIPTRGRPELLARAVASVLDQEYPGEIEALVVYDGVPPMLSDGEPRPGRRLRVLRNDRSPGAAGARNCGMLAAHGNLLALCDDDDRWLAGKLARQVAALLAEPDAVGAGGGFVLRQGRRTIVRLPRAARMTHRDLLRSRVAAVHPSTLVLWRRYVLTRAGLMDEEIPGSYGEDYDWLLRITRDGFLVTAAEPLAEVLWHPGSYFAGQWDTIAQAIQYLLAKHSDLHDEPSGVARLYGRLAFAFAAQGQRAEARRWALATLRRCPWERRAYLAFGASLRMLSPRAAMRLANLAGKGI